MSEPYAGMHDYLKDYFSLLALRLHREVLLARMLRGPGTDEAFLGLFLSEEEVNGILARLHGATLPHNDQTMDMEDRIVNLTAQIEKRLAAVPQPLRLQQLARLFDLGSFATELLLFLLAPEVDSRFGWVYAYLQDDVSRRWLCPGLALRLLPDTAPDDPAGRALFAQGSPLLRERLIRMGDDTEGPPAPLIDRPLKLDDRIAEYLLEHDTLSTQLEKIASLEHTGPGLDDLALNPGLRARLDCLQSLGDGSALPPTFFWGRAGSGKAVVAAVLAKKKGRGLLTVDAAMLALQPPEKVQDLLHEAAREALLIQAVLLVRHLDALDENCRVAVKRLLRPGIILSARTLWQFHDLADPPIVIHFPVPGHPLRQELWCAAMGDGDSVDGHLAAELASRFRLTPGQIAQAARTAQHCAWLRAGPDATPDHAELFEGCRLQSNPGLSQLATKVVSPHGWEDLVLPNAQIAQLRSIEAQVHHTHTVYHQWGFDSKLALGKGLNALFSGPSGTGKTMAAGVLARDLGLDMYKIDLSGVVSKYIGETEKNLSRIFEEASTANAILFFDEADALFGRRSEVKDAHDRYANIEISYLLQKMEEYDGVAILATNFSQNLDESFTRRMQFIVEFPLPQAGDRERIWQGLFPAGAPRSDDIDFTFLATQFDLSGGNIKNCVVAAAFMAAEEGTPICMAHLVQGVVREMGKLGRPLTRSSFGAYYMMARRMRS